MLSNAVSSQQKLINFIETKLIPAKDEYKHRVALVDEFEVLFNDLDLPSLDLNATIGASSLYSLIIQFFINTLMGSYDEISGRESLTQLEKDKRHVERQAMVGLLSEIVTKINSVFDISAINWNYHLTYEASDMHIVMMMLTAKEDGIVPATYFGCPGDRNMVIPLFSPVYDQLIEQGDITFKDLLELKNIDWNFSSRAPGESNLVSAMLLRMFDVSREDRMQYFLCDFLIPLMAKPNQKIDICYASEALKAFSNSESKIEKTLAVQIYFTQECDVENAELDNIVIECIKKHGNETETLHQMLAKSFSGYLECMTEEVKDSFISKLLESSKFKALQKKSTEPVDNPGTLVFSSLKRKRHDVGFYNEKHLEQQAWDQATAEVVEAKFRSISSCSKR